MRLGGPVFGDVSTPELWISALQRKRYSAAYCPVGNSADHATIAAYGAAAKASGIVIAEVGAWSNTISADESVRQAAIEHCIRQLDLAERIGARCCVNIAGSRGEQWDGPHPDNLTEDTFHLIVETVRAIIDAVKPARSFYTMETMPWVFPERADSYLRLIKAIDRKEFGVHLDPVNLISSPQIYFSNAAFLRDCFAKLGPYIKSCHAKDITLSGKMTVHLDEVRPGLGSLDYNVFVRELNRLDKDIPLMLEHLPNEEEYDLAAQYVTSIIESEGIVLR